MSTESLGANESLPTASAKGDERVWQEDLEVVTPYYGVDDVPPPLETLLYAWQHTLVDVSPYVLPLMVAAAVGYTADQAAAMISACLTVMGLATFANATWGNRLPSVLGPSATDTGAMATAGAIYGAPAGSATCAAASPSRGSPQSSVRCSAACR